MDIEVFFEEKMKVNARIGKHLIKTDQPMMAGGDGSAPAPFDYFLSSIATCSGIYVKRFCDQRGINSENIKIIQKHTFNQNTHRIEKIEMEILLPDDFPEKYRSAIINVAGQCSVKKHLFDPPEFDIRTV